MPLRFNSEPYYDDYDETKGFLKILFRPGYAVQARELTQVQDILQNQVSRFGSFVFKSGSAVLGGQLTLDTDVVYANVQPQYNNTNINLNNFANTIITDAETSTIRASVVAISPQLSGSNDPPVLMLKYLTGTTFANGANVKVEGSNTNFALLANSSSQGTGSIASIRDGVYFIDLNNINASSNANANTVSTITNGYFVRVPSQTIVLNKYNNKPTYKVGLQISDRIVTEQTDSSLLDPAVGATNYQAPGATRYIIDAILSKREFTSQDDTSFIELLRIDSGQLNSAQKYPVLSDLADTLARRTYDQSGSFTVIPFGITLLETANNDVANSNNQLYYIGLDAGKAYVQGYEYETIGKTYLSAPKARNLVNVSQYEVQTYYGNYINVDNVRGEFNISTLPSVDIHCIDSSNVNTRTTQAYSNTLIGTARLRAFEYSTASNTANGLTHVFRAHLFDVNTGSIISTSSGATATTITFGPLFSAVDNAYSGMTINIPSTGDLRTITSYNGANKIATVSSSWSSNPTSTGFNLLCTISAAESLGLNTNTGFISANSNINNASKSLVAPYSPAYITDVNFQPLIFRLPNATVGSGFQNPTYQYRYRVATGQTLQAGSPLVVNLTIPGDSTAKFTASGISGSDLVSLTNFLAVTNPGGGVAGQIVPMVSSLSRSISATDTTATFTMAGGDPTFTNVDVFASITSELGQKTKTKVLANTSAAISAGGTSVGNSTVYLASGQVSFTTPKNTNLTSPNNPQSLYISDVINLVAVIDSGAAATPVSAAMVQAAANNTTMPGSSRNITSNYTFFNGQKDTHYDHATITLKPGAPSPVGQVYVLVNYYTHSSSGGYFTVDSYPTYTDIPVYQTNTTSGSLALRDCIDFRPRRDDATVAYTFSNSGTIFLPEPIPTEGFSVDFSYYLGRIDRIVLTKNGDFRIIQGISSLNPTAPDIPDGSMLLYTLAVPPYTFYSANVKPQMFDNKRYTMRDIGRLEKRIQALEYYTQLNALEKNATQQTIVDGSGLSRPKNGILVDNFQGSSVADVANPDYYAAVDTQRQELRPAFNINEIPLNFISSLSSNYSQKGKILTLPYSTVTFIEQPFASRTENLNPFNLTVWNGTLELNPESDTWVDINQAPAVVTNIAGDNDAWIAVGQAFNDPRNPYSVTWNNWQTVWSGVDTSSYSYNGPVYRGQQVPGVFIDQAHAEGDFSAFVALQDTVQRTTSVTVENQARTGIMTTLSSDTITKSIGTNVIDISVVPYMRANKINFVAKSMKPLTNVFPYFNGINVTEFTQRASIATFTNTVTFQDDYGNEERIYDTDGGTNGGFGANSALIIACKDNKVWITDIIGVVASGKTFRGEKTGATHVVSSFSHLSGVSGEPAGKRYLGSPFVNGVSPSANSTGIYLHGSASSVDNYYTGNAIYISKGTGANKGAQIVSYNGASRFATVSPAWGISLSDVNEQIYYTIGEAHITDDNGQVCGSFIVPNSVQNRFATGTGVFRLMDSRIGDFSTSKTKAEDTFVSSGTLKTTQEQFVSTRVPVLRTQTVSETRTVTGNPVVTDQVIGTNVIEYIDPIAQNFLVDNKIYPNGVFISSVRVCFFSKDEKIPVTLQIRPTTNGFPNSGTIIPLGEVSLSPSRIKVTTIPNLDNPAHYTEFTFFGPIHLLPGNEYSIVLISNSNKYEVYTAVVGEKFLGSDRLIAQPPYLGVFFKSQNSSTWSPFQGESLMFRINKCVFNITNPMSITFASPKNNSNVGFPGMTNSEIYMDTTYINTSEQILKDTNITYGYRATSNTSRTLDSGYTNIITRKNYDFTSRKVLTPAGNSFYLQASGISLSTDISPIIDTERYSVLAISNRINNGEITNNNITITNPGVGYNVANTNIITVSGGNGSGAQLSIGSVDANGNITSIVVNNGGGGAGYNKTPNTSVTTSGYNATAQSFFVISGETNPSGGNYLTKYITRKVTLAQGMDASDLQVTFDAHKPAGTQIYVYYKVESAEDNDLFDNKPYVLMKLYGVDSYSLARDDFTEYSYVPNLDQYGNPVRQITYDSFDTFKYFAIKIVMGSNDPANVPRIKNLRIFAMPSA